MCISGALGGILGGVMEMGQVHGVLTGIQEGMQFFLNSVRTWMLPLMAICGVIALVLCEQYMGRLKRAGEAMEQAEDEAYERLDYELEAAGSRGMIVSFAGSIAMILFLATGYSTKYIESLNGSGIMWFLLEILTFIALEVYLNVWQIRYVRVIQKIYPDKKGDPTSLKFPKQWLESCDEAEKECIYQASYKGYQTVMSNFLDVFKTRWSASVMNETKGEKMYYYALGNEFNFSPKWHAYFDWMYSHEGVDRKGIITSIVGTDNQAHNAFNAEYMSYVLHVNYRFAPKWNLFAKGMYETASVYKASDEVEKGKYRTAWGYAGGIEFYPMESNLHFFLAYVGRSYKYTDRAKALGEDNFSTHRVSVGFIWQMPVF